MVLPNTDGAYTFSRDSRFLLQGIDTRMNVQRHASVRKMRIGLELSWCDVRLIYIRGQRQKVLELS